MNIPTHLWLVTDNSESGIIGTPHVYKTREVAELKARLWDLEYPNLAPHQVMVYSLSLSALENVHAESDATVPAETQE